MDMYITLSHLPCTRLRLAPVLEWPSPNGPLCHTLTVRMKLAPVMEWSTPRLVCALVVNMLLIAKASVILMVVLSISNVSDTFTSVQEQIITTPNTFGSPSKHPTINHFRLWEKRRSH